MVEDMQHPDKAASEKKVADNKKKKQKAEEDKDADLSEEDLELKNNLLLMVTRIGEGDPGVQKLALQQIANEIRSATTSMTSVPKPLKFLRAHYQTLVNNHDKTADVDVKRQLADVLSVLAITTSKEGERACLKYRLLGSRVCAHLRFLLHPISAPFISRMMDAAWADQQPCQFTHARPDFRRQTQRQELQHAVLCRRMWLHGATSISGVCQERLARNTMCGERRMRMWKICWALLLK